MRVLPVKKSKKVAFWYSWRHGSINFVASDMIFMQKWWKNSWKDFWTVAKDESGNECGDPIEVPHLINPDQLGQLTNRIVLFPCRYQSVVLELRVSPSVLKRPRKACMDVFLDNLSKKVRKMWKTGKPVFWKLSVFLSDIKTDIIFGISGIENPRKNCFYANRTFSKELLR